MKRILFFVLFISVSLLSFSQRNKTDTFNLFQKTKKTPPKDITKEIQSSPQSNQGSVYYAKHGTSEGKCAGYCFHESSIDSINTVTVSKSLRAEKNYPIKTDTARTIQTQWDMLISSIDISSFFAMPEKIGNPGGDDGTSEWIEINYAGKIHKVTFDSSGPDEYEGIKNLLKLFKKITEN
ncbi:MAG: hypothetical protein HY841_11630 [Bacteroidetes bacterium]|nr:hypothetical protein [Bacteroidota bacterium]